MYCSLSGEVPQEPVVSKKSCLLFEKRLIERHILDNGKCPCTGEPLSMDDIIPIKTDTVVEKPVDLTSYKMESISQSCLIMRPRPVQAASIPGMLGMFQHEWDCLMLSYFALEKQLHTARQELSHALYQHDAACRVIARLKKERDEARSLLAQAHQRQMSIPSSVANIAGDASSLSNAAADGKKMHPGISSNILEELNECSIDLTKQRKKRQIPPTLAPVEALEYYTQVSSHPLHKTTKPGIVSLDIHPSKDIIATGGLDSNVVFFDQASGQILSTIVGHTKKVTSVKFVARDDIFLSASADKTVRIWKMSDAGSYNCSHILKDHSAEVQAVAVHVVQNPLEYHYYKKVDDLSGSGGYTSAAIHPDGLILGTGTSEALVKVWDVKSQTNIANFEGHIGAVNALSFSENGFHLATAATDGVKVWDLRKTSNYLTLSPYGSDTPINSVEFDHSGRYLALAGPSISVYQVANLKSEWNCVKTLPDLSGTGKVACLKFGPNAKYIAVGSMDRNLRIFGLQAAEDNIDHMES